MVEAHVDEDGGGPSAKFTHRRPWRRGVGVEEEERARASERVQRRVEGDESDLVLIEVERAWLPRLPTRGDNALQA